MNQQQTRAGARHRSAAALAVAEAGIYRALSVLEGNSPDDGGAGRVWRPAGHSEEMAVGPLRGRFTVSVVEGAGEAVVITSVGEVAGVTRRLRAQVHLASPALLASLNGAGMIRLENPPAATYTLPYSAAIRDWPWIHLAAGRGMWLANTDVSINDPNANLLTGPGPLEMSAGAAGPPPAIRPVAARLMMPRGAALMIDPGRQQVDIQQLRAMGVRIDGDILRSEALSQFPQVVRAYYATLAAANTANAHLNSAAGRLVGDDGLARKQDSLYSQREFEQLQTYLAAGLEPARFSGIVYVKGRVALFGRQQATISDGSLIAEGSVLMGPDSSLEITHSALTRTRPGLITLDDGPLVLARGARLRVHGLVFASRFIYIGEDARVDVVGSILGSDTDLSFRNTSGVVAIRYDPAVLGTRGLRAPSEAPVIAWVSAWRELP